jgi:hypothetical protein
LSPLRVVVLTLLLSCPALLDAGRGTLGAAPLAARLLVACLLAVAGELLLTGVLAGRRTLAPSEDEAGGAAGPVGTDRHAQRRRTDV